MTRIVVLGAGYAGVACGVRLQKLGIPFTLINKHSYHHFTTLLHELAGGRNEAKAYYVSLARLFHPERVNLIKDTVQEIHPREKRIVCVNGEQTYDWLVVALGNVPEYFGIPGLKEHALVLRSLETAKAIRNHIEEQFALFPMDRDAARLRIVVGGGGLTGIELCGELAEWIPRLAAKYRVPQELAQVINLEAAPEILPMLDDQLQETARHVLTRKGVQLRTGQKITRVGQGVVELASGEKIECRTIIWAGGVRAHPLLQEAGFTCDSRGRAQVNEYLQSVDDPDVFVLGDAASFPGSDGQPLPPTAQLATQMGQHCAQTIDAFLHQQQAEPFVYHYMGTLASLGSEVGVGIIRGFKTSGVPAGLLKEVTKLKYLYYLGGLRLIAQKSGQFIHLR